MEVENIYLKSIHFCIVPGLDKFQKYIIHSDKIEGKQSLCKIVNIVFLLQLIC